RPSCRTHSRRGRRHLVPLFNGERSTRTAFAKAHNKVPRRIRQRGSVRSTSYSRRHGEIPRGQARDTPTAIPRSSSDVRPGLSRIAGGARTRGARAEHSVSDDWQRGRVDRSSCDPLGGRMATKNAALPTAVKSVCGQIELFDTELRVSDDG